MLPPGGVVTKMGSALSQYIDNPVFTKINEIARLHSEETDKI